MTRFRFVAIAFVAQCVVAACASRNSQNLVDRESGATAFLSREAYLIALDSSLARLGQTGKRVFIYGADSRLPFTAEDLRVRRVKLAESASVCPGQAALWFQAPQRQEYGHIRLDVVEATGESGLAGGRSYLFGCTLGTCRLEGDGPTNSDYMVGCRVSTISSATPIPAAVR